MSIFTQSDYSYMKYALQLAEKARGFTSPNPMVGAVIVKNGRIIGEGYHKRYGDWHAEVNAFDSAEESVEGATMYVTLEPCSHTGKTPPCADKIIEKKIGRVIIGAKDPNPLVSGRGIEKLKNAGIEVSTGLLEEESIKLNEVFMKYITEKRPFVLYKSAVTLDGKIATYTGKSKWISNEKAREEVHYLGSDLTCKNNSRLKSQNPDFFKYSSDSRQIQNNRCNASGRGRYKSVCTKKNGR